MKRRGYVLLFVLVLLVAGIGGFLGARLLLQRLQQDFALAPQAEWTPEPTPPAAVTVGVVPTEAVSQAAPATSTRRPTATVLVVTPLAVAAPEITPLAPTAVDTPRVDPFATPAVLPGFEIGGASTAAPSVTPAAAFPFAPVRAVRYTNGDCPGTYALGQVTDRNGAPLANVRLNLVDEFDNAQFATTKSNEADAGRYDFPMFGAPRRFYMTVIDEGGRALSERVEIIHELPPHENQPCRWLDWRRR